MVLPMPQLSHGSVTAWAYKMRNPLLVLLFLQCIVGAVRLYELDIFGGFYIFATSMIGYYSLRNESIDMSCLTTYGIICFISAIFDVVVIINHVVHSVMPFFSAELPWTVNLIHAILIAGPVCLGVSAFICYLIYQDSNSSQSTEQYNYASQRPSYSQNYGTNASQFVPFQGKGQSLGSQTTTI